MSAASHDEQRQPIVLAASLLWLIVVMTWRGVIQAPFVHDDLVQIVDREQQLVAPWASWGAVAVAQRPMVQLTLGLNHLVGGLDPRGYHALNVGLHGMAAVLCLCTLWAGSIVLRRRGLLTPAPRSHAVVCVLAAAAWALHPLQTAAVSYVIQRGEILVAIGAFGALIGVLRASQPGSGLGVRALAIGGCWFAMLSKPTAVIVPALVLAADAALAAGSWREAIRLRWRLHLACWSSLVVLVAVGTIAGLFGGEGPSRSVGFGSAGPTVTSYLQAQVGAVGLYGAELLVPSMMSIDHGWTLLARAWPWVAGSSLIIACFVAIASGLIRGAWWWIVPAIPAIALLPTSSVVPLRDPVADHRVYLALLGPVLACSLGAAIIARHGRRAAGAVIIVGVAVIVAECRQTVLRNDAWCRPERLWSDVLAVRPDDAKAFVNRSLAHIAAGDDVAARIDALRALAIRPADGPALAMLGLLEVRAGHDVEALAALERAEALGVRTGAVRGAMGDALRGLGRPCEAAVAYGKAARRSPSLDRLPLLEGICLAECGDQDAAVRVLRGVEERTRDESIRARAKATLDAMRSTGAGPRDDGARAKPSTQAPEQGGSEP